MNRVPREVVDAFSTVFRLLQGSEGGNPGNPRHFALWAAQNPTEFYRLYAKLLPRNLEVRASTTVGVVILPPLGSGTASTTIDHSVEQSTLPAQPLYLVKGSSEEEGSEEGSEEDEDDLPPGGPGLDATVKA